MSYRPGDHLCVVPRELGATFGVSYGWPGPVPAAPFKSFITRHEYTASHFYCAYPQASTRMVKGALAVRERFERLVEDSARLDSEAFAAAYERFLVESQAQL